MKKFRMRSSNTKEVFLEIPLHVAFWKDRERAVHELPLVMQTELLDPSAYASKVKSIQNGGKN